MFRIFSSFDSDSESATITASSALANYPVSRLANPVVADVWKTTGASASEAIYVDLGAEMSIDAFALLGHDFTASDSGFLFEADATYPIPTEPTISISLSYHAQDFIVFFEPEDDDVRYCQFTFTKATASAIRSAGRLLIGTHYQCPRSPLLRTPQWGMEAQGLQVQRTQHGQQYTDGAWIPRTFRATFPACPQAMLDELTALARDQGLWSPFLISQNWDEQPYAMSLYGRLAQAPQATHHRAEGDDVFDITLDMVEVN